jgi:hypothetical protein
VTGVQTCALPICEAAGRIEELEKQIQTLNVVAQNYIKLAEEIGGCGDSSCVVVRPKGMCTNGGCRCYKYIDTDKGRKIGRLLLIAGELDRATLKAETQ